MPGQKHHPKHQLTTMLLRQHGLHVTEQRLAVLRAVSDRPHSTADDIDKAVGAEIGAISRQAVYDALSVLTDKGLLRRIQPAGLVDVVCGAVRPVGHRPQDGQTLLGDVQAVPAEQHRRQLMLRVMFLAGHR